ncbi:AraC family transcriptional regulator [Bacteroides sp. 224]|uniref:helix-turn-helix domain-containing protein n=1 Tax=Bacteroides sp. 224 TaxID=2302936 RepID=UPI0013D3EEBE|nr:helix-turn-helix domain-containing protein [Bacteroides sp. 224]NDV64394.1 AraC family transcriptional regulator [Bacteroides sp. 224]
MTTNTPTPPPQYQLEVYPAVSNSQRFASIQDNDFIIFNDLKSMPLYEAPTRMETSVVSICTNGYTRITINMQEYYISSGTLLIIFPDQIMQSLEISDDFQGVFIAVSKKLSDEVYPKLKVILPLFFYTKEYPCINLSGEEVGSLMNYYDLFWGKIKRENSYYSKEIIQGILVSMFYEIYDLYRRRVPRKSEKRNRKEVLFDQFMRLLSESYRKERSVNFYAKELFLTPKHLSSVVKEVSGKTAGEWIDVFVIFEAKSLLKSSQKNIQEISDELNFANQSFFGKYFKHYTGMSPKEYRKL